MMSFNSFHSTPLSPNTQNRIRTVRSYNRAASFPSDIHQHKMISDVEFSYEQHQDHHHLHHQQQQQSVENYNEATATDITRLNSYFPNVNIPSYNRFQNGIPMTSSSCMSFSAPESESEKVNRSAGDLLTNSDLLNSLLNANFGSDFGTSLSEGIVPTITQAAKAQTSTELRATQSMDNPTSSNSKNSSSGRSLTSSATKPKAKRRGRTKCPKSANLVCEICHQRYSRRDNLRTHQRVHSGEKPFQCKYCNTPFRWVSALRNHEALHTRQTQSGRKKGLYGKKVGENRVGSDVQKCNKNDALNFKNSPGNAVPGGNDTINSAQYADSGRLKNDQLDCSEHGNKFVSVEKTSNLQESSIEENSLNEYSSIHQGTMNSSLSTTHSNSSSSNINNNNNNNICDAQNSIRHRAVMSIENRMRHEDISLNEIFGFGDADMQAIVNNNNDLRNYSHFPSNRNEYPK